VSPDAHHRSAYFAWIAVCLVWGTTYLGIRVAVETIPPALVGGIRYTIAGSVLAIWLRLRGQPLPPRDQWPGLAVVAFLLIAIGNGFVIWAEQWVPSGIAAVTVASSPFWMTAMEAVVAGGERITLRGALGLCVGFAGIVLLVWPDLTAGASGRDFMVGVLALQLACVGWAAGSTYSKRFTPVSNALAASATQMLIGGVIMLAVGTVTGEWNRLAFSVRSATAEVYLIVMGSLVGYSAYLHALRYLPVSTVSLYAYVNPVIAVILGAVLLDEPVNWRVVMASAMVLAGIGVVRAGGRR
jgi:drug/metabolite transporter (DMT)-like permease